MLSAFFIYNAILILSTFFVYYAGRCRYKFDRYILLFLTFLVLFIPAAIRYNVGADFESYTHIYNNLDSYLHLEPAYLQLNIILQKLQLHPQYLFIITSALIYGVYILSIPNSRFSWIYHIFFMTMLYFFSLAILRQAIALSFSLIAFQALLKRKYLLFTINIIIGILFHKSTLLVLLLAPIAMIKIDKKNRFNPTLAISLSLFFIMFSSEFITFSFDIARALNIHGASYYQNHLYFSGAANTTTGLGVILKLIIPLTLIFTAKNIVANNTQYYVAIIFSMAYLLSVILASQIHIFGRVSRIFEFMPIIGIYLILHYKAVSIKNIFILIVIIANIAVFQKTIYTEQYGSRKGLEISPYQTIFGSEAKTNKWLR